MIRWTWAAVVGAAVAGCASAGDPAARDVARAPATWNPGEREAPRARTAPSQPEIPGRYPETTDGPSVYLVPEARSTAVGRGSADRRRLAGRGPSFMAAIGGPGVSAPLRRAVWAEDAYPAVTAADSVRFATPWVPAARLPGEVRCEAAPGARPRARLAALFRVAGDDLLIEAWMETDGAAACLGERGARERVRAFADDLDRFAREAARRGVPVPLPGG